MPIASSGALSLNDIQTEFGGSNPIGINEYYAGGSYVPAGTTGTNGAVPSSGQISISNFYGTSASLGYIEDFFSTYLYTGNGSTQTITNGIDLAGKGGMVWSKCRSSTLGGNGIHTLMDTIRGAGYRISSELTGAQVYNNNTITAFNSTGFNIGNSPINNTSAETFASWTFRKQPKFFDIVTYTGNGVDGRTISHNLGSTPGFMLVKCTSNGSTNWLVYHRSAPNGGGGELLLNSTAAASTSNCATGGYFGSITSTSFRVFQTDPNTGNNVTPTEVNVSGYTYVAYLFAHNAGGFGLTGSDNVISCGSFTTNASNGVTGEITLGYEPQWVMMKCSSTTSNWIMVDNMRGFAQTLIEELDANSSGAAVSVSGNYIYPTATGFGVSNGTLNSSQTWVYIAIRRGPMKVPTSGTSVFGTRVRAGDNTSSPLITPSTDMTTDMTLTMNKSGGVGGSAGAGAVGGFVNFDRLRGYKALYTSSSNLEPSPGAVGFNFARMNGVIGATLDTGQFFNYDTNNESYAYINYFFRRAPSFFDVVCYTGNGPGTQVINHNLAVVPELVINKVRSTTSGWTVFRGSTTALTGFLRLNDTTAAGGDTLNVSATTITVNSTIGFGMNTSGQTYVTYLFATCAGVSKVGSYTGTGTTLQVNCGFTGGARFVLIKRTDSTGDWYVWDSARGIVAGNDPYLLLNSNTAEVTNTDYIDTYSAGFEISSTAPAAINANGGTYIFLAIA